MSERVTATVTLRELIEKLRQIGLPDSRFAADLEEIQASQPPIGDAPWPSDRLQRLPGGASSSHSEN